MSRRTPDRWWSRPGGAVLLLSVLAAVACTGAPPPARHAAPRSHPPATRTAPDLAAAGNIRAQNALPGDPHWRITDPAHLYQLEGFADHTDVLPGASFRLFVSTTAASFRVLAFRIGWYGGDLARLVWTSPAAPGRYQAAAKIVQPGSMVVAPWSPSLTVPTTGWPPGSYLLRLDASTGVQSYLPITIRSPSVAGRVVLVSAVTSYQAYNGWGGYSLYGGPGGTFANRSRLVTFDRPLSYNHGAGAYFQLELPLVAFAERLGLPLAYLTSVDLDLYPQVLAGARAVISEAHDEYWSTAMRAVLTRARDHGTNVAFFGANAIFRKIRFESSPLGPDRVEVNYKIPQEDPLYGKDNALVTGNWPTPPAADPESSLVGQSYVCSFGPNVPMIVTDPGNWIWAGSGVYRGESLPGLEGPEVDQVNPAEPTPRPLEVLAQSPVSCGALPSYSDVTYYVAGRGAGVFDAGTEDWICALPAASDCPASGVTQPAVRRAIQAATANILTAFAAGPAGRAHPAHELIPGTDGRPPVLGIS
ncbi:MAG: N,N-dimethylformamidase beta subunit family domain-containing protein [Streptosporangiaceae bacterium]